MLTALYKRELVYFDVPISLSDHVSIPPLEVHCCNLLLVIAQQNHADSQRNIDM